VYTIFQLSPFDALSLTSSIFADVILICFFAAYGKWWSVFAFFLKVAVTGSWIFYMFALKIFPDIFKIDVDYSVTVVSVHGPWIETVILLLIVIALVVVVVLQQNFIVIFPIILCVLWIVFYWIFKSKRELPVVENTEPSAPPASVVLQPSRRLMVWPRVKIPVREKDA
jgi:hypothetical protein